MRRPAAVVGFSWFFALLAGTFCPIGGTMALLFLCLAAGVVSLFVRPLRIVKVVPTALLTAAVAMGSICLATFLTVLPIQSLDGVNCRMEGIITDLPTPKGERMLYPVKVTSVDADGAPQEFNIFLSCRGQLPARTFDEISADVHFYTSGAKEEKGAYIAAYTLGDVQVKEAEVRPVYAFVVDARQKLMETNRETLSSDAAEVINGVLLGADDQIDPKIKQAFRDTGIAHLLAVSGAHISIFTNFVLMVLMRFKVNRRVAAVLAAGFAFGFMALTGFTPSVMRAGLMSIIYLLGLAARKKADSLNSLGLAAFLLTILNPFAVRDLGLIMSLMATLGMIVLSARMESWMIRPFANVKRGRRIINGIVATVAQSLSASLFLLPITIVVFERVSLISPVTNVLCMLPASIMMIASGIGSMLHSMGMLAFISNPCLLVAGLLAKYLIAVTGLLSGVPFAVISTSQGFVLVWLAGTILLFCLAFLLRKDVSLFQSCTALSAIVLMIGILSYQISMRGVTSIKVMNSENVLSAAVVRDGRAAVIGCGGSYNAAARIQNYLQDEGIRRLEMLVLPSMEEEFASGAQELLGSFPVDMVLAPAEADLTALKAASPDTEFYPYDSADIRFWEGFDVTASRQGEESALRMEVGETEILLSTNNADVTFVQGSHPDVALLGKELPANFQKCTPDVALTPSGGLAPIYLAEREVESILVGEKTDLIIMTRGKGDVLIRRD
ncbi:ComEC family competence protein [Eubacteriaceae bacterium CHKCI005]|nr:ComEC family competence protein [Eubacteriaceae bacterium CHKCI005]